MLGQMKSLCWTDHANWTKQQTAEIVDIDCKHLRWVSEIVSDGSEIRSLSGRSARLGDGTSRNPSNRDQLVNQRSKDLQGIIGQVRDFDLGEFLCDWEQEDAPIPWALGDHGWVSKKDVDLGAGGIQVRYPCSPCVEGIVDYSLSLIHI